MEKVHEVAVPQGSFLETIGQQDGVYTDCFAVMTVGEANFADYIEAFYTTPIFRAERVLLRLFARAPSTDHQARALGEGTLDTFSVWHVQKRSENQLLMREGRTSSWFMLVPSYDAEVDGCVLMFGSVVFPNKDKKTGKLKIGFLFKALLGVHKFYSRMLLSAARRRLLRA